ncbi:MAG: hypothetical protein HQL77_16900 [Magnetococcales bacterium]|nr:hypothetical protein [Magnetococcales bacterium]
MVDRIEQNGVLYGFIVRNSFKSQGVNFFTSDDSPQQLALITHKNGHLISPHLHNPVNRNIVQTQEALIVKSGRIRVDFYTRGAVYIESRILEPWDILFLMEGGHGFEVLESVEMVEVKQGPYVGTQDKTVFPGVSPRFIVLR